MRLYLFIAMGGAIGACLRFGTAAWIQNRAGTFPWGTFAVNVLGCLLMGILFHWLYEASDVSTDLRTGITVGILGAFTTFSTFSLDTLKLLQDGQWRYATGYVLGTNMACLLAVWIGFVMMRKIHP